MAEAGYISHFVELLAERSISDIVRLQRFRGRLEPGICAQRKTTAPTAATEACARRSTSRGIQFSSPQIALLIAPESMTAHAAPHLLAGTSTPQPLKGPHYAARISRWPSREPAFATEG